MDEILMRAPEELKAHPRNREFFDDIEGENWTGFVNSIEQNGIIEPIVIDQNDVIISGHQRVRAAKELGMKIVPTVTEVFDTEDDALRALIDTNVKQRGVLPNNAKLGRIFAEEMRLNGNTLGVNQHTEEPLNNVQTLTKEQIAEKLGYSLRTLYNAEKLSKLPDEYHELIENGTINASAGARLIASMDGDEQAALFAKLRSFPQAHFTNDDIEKFKKEVQEENTRRLQEMREDFKEQMEEKEAGIRAEYEGVIEEQEQTIERMKAEHGKDIDDRKERYRKLAEAYEQLNKDHGALVQERVREKYTMIQHDEGDGDASLFATYCKDFLKGVSRYQYVMDGFPKFGVMRQEEIRKAAYAMKAFIDNIIDCIDAEKGIEE